MCGFLIEHNNVGDINEDHLNDLLLLSKKRGPDNTKTTLIDNTWMGFNRLSIQGLSELSNQPMVDEKEQYALVFNGEIYNHFELRKKLPNHDFKTNSDTETLFELLKENGIKSTLKKLNGMFSFSFFNKKNSEIVIARDIAGIKPLFYSISEDFFLISSQFDQIHEHEKIRYNLKINPAGVKDFFCLGYMPSPNTILNNVFQLEPGSYLRYSLKEKKIIEKKNFWNWKESPKKLETDEKIIEEFETIMSGCVESQLLSDVPVGTFLSGGIDSPLINYFVNRKTKLRSFSFYTRDSKHNEILNIEKYNKVIKSKNQKILIDDTNLLEIIGDYIENISEPLSDPSSIPTYYISKIGAKSLKVLLSGDGADELFWGYPRFLKSIKHLKYFKIPKLFRKNILKIFRIFNRKISYGIDNCEFGDWILNQQIHLTNYDKIFKGVKFSKQIRSLYKYNNKDFDKTLLFLKRNEFFGHMERVLKKVDLASMANSLEVRVPYLDKDVIEYSLKIQPELGRNNNTPKLILRNLLSKKFKIDAKNEVKKGFSVPHDEWLRGPLRKDLIRLSKKEIFASSYFDSKLLQDDVRLFLDGNDKVNSRGVWTFYCWQKWSEKYRLIK